jgi:hypothetical protein
MGSMEKKDTRQPVVCILGSDNKEAAEIRRIVLNHAYPYRTETYTTVPALKSGLAAVSCMAAILDLDSVPLDNRAIRNLTLAFPSVCFLCASRDRFHPELKDAICYHLFACLTKPIDPDELHYFLKCIRADFIGEAL